MKAKVEVEQHGYDVGMAETEDALKAEVPGVCRTYCVLVWDEAVNQAEVEASSMLRKAESVYYLPTIRPSSSQDSKANPASSEAGEIRGSPPKAPPAAKTSSMVAKDTTNTGDVHKEVIEGVDLPPIAPKDLFKEKETS